MTNREFLNNIIANEDFATEMREHAGKMLAQMDATLEKRKAKPSKAAIANEPIKVAIIDYLTEQTEPALAATVANALEISVQKASSLLRGLVEENKLTQKDIKVPKKGTQKAYEVIKGE
jgi:hypothetical protein